MILFWGTILGYEVQKGTNMKFILSQSALSWASDWVVIAGAMVDLLVLAMVAAAASHLASSSMVLAVATIVDLMQAMALEATQSLSIPLPVLAGL